MSEIEVKDLWNKHWKSTGSIEDIATPIGKYLRRERLKIILQILSLIDKTKNVIDIGCGGGRTLQVIRSAGFNNSIGIDFSDMALKSCEKHGFEIDKDVFLMDANNITYPNRFFYLSFSEGLWEHFKDPTPYMNEQIRVTDKYLLIVQPDHFSLFGWLLNLGCKLFGSKHAVKEYSFRMEYFKIYVEDRGFKMLMKKSTHLNEQGIMLFKRR